MSEDDLEHGAIRSADVAELTSPDLAGLKQLINEAGRQRATLAPDFAAALESRLKAWRKLRRREQLPLRAFLGRSIPAVRSAFESAEREATTVGSAIAASSVRIDVPLNADATAAYSALDDAHAALSRALRVWDVTASVGIDRHRTRSAASNAMTRMAVNLSRSNDGVVTTDRPCLRFGNANGGDLDLYPGFALMRSRHSDDYALVDFRELRMDASATHFIEEEAVPADAMVVDHAWERSNRDGSPDRRFRDNREFPVARYGEIRFSSSQGLSEAYLISNCEASLAFGSAFQALQSALGRQALNNVEQTAPSLSHDPQPVALPSLPAVSGAHELTLAAVLLVFAPLLIIRLKPPPPGVVPPSSTNQAVINGPLSRVASPSTTGKPVAESQSAALPTPTITLTAPSVPPTSSINTNPSTISQKPAVRMTTVSNANLRQAANQQSPIVRVFPTGSVLQVFSRYGVWIQVGDDKPAGWVHESLLRRLD